jgi:hypothetical protein
MVQQVAEQGQGRPDRVVHQQRSHELAARGSVEREPACATAARHDTAHG